MRFVAYVKSGGRDPQDRMMGVVIDDKVAPLASIDAFYEDLPGWKQRASELSEGEIPLADLTLAPPVPRDAKIVCAAINYVKHGAEANLPTPTFPNLFARWASELVVNGAEIPVPVAEPHGLDWEVELAAIVGIRTIDADETTVEDLEALLSEDDVAELQKIEESVLHERVGKTVLEMFEEQLPNIQFASHSERFKMIDSIVAQLLLPKAA